MEITNTEKWEGVYINLFEVFQETSGIVKVQGLVENRIKTVAQFEGDNAWNKGVEYAENHIWGERG